MRKTFLWIPVLMVFAFVACQEDKQQENTEEVTEVRTIYGAEFEPVAMISPEDVKGKLGDDSVSIQVQGNIKTCCQKKGCWMTMDIGNGEDMRVTFRDYGFFVPTNSAGKTAILNGKAYYDTTSVEMLRHYAEDEGKSTEEIEAITEPEVQVAFLADGVIIVGENAGETETETETEEH